jgi:lysophospholipase L1-like esterase
VLFSVILIAAVLSLGELAVRVYANYFRTPYERYNPTTGRLELVPNLRQVRRDGSEMVINSRGFLGLEFDERPSTDVYRIMAVGDSCTFFDGFWRRSYPGILHDYLNRAAGGPRFEVINAGIEGYNSTFARERIEQELIAYRPRLVLLYVGWNDLMKVDPRNAAAVGRYAWVGNFLERSYLVRAYRKVMFIHLRPLLFRPKTAIDTADSRAYDDFVPATYEGNLRAIVQRLRQSGIQSMLFTLPTVVRPGMTGEEIEKRHVFFPYFAGTYSVGEFLSLHRAYNASVRRVGATLDVPVLDLEAVFDARDKDELFWDTMHPSQRGQCLIARELYARLGPSLGLTADAPPDDAKICR